MKERTLSIVKPDAVKKNAIGDILRRFENAGLKIVAARMTTLSKAQAQGFYAVHKERPFFKDLVSFMKSLDSLSPRMIIPSSVPSGLPVAGGTK